MDDTRTWETMTDEERLAHYCIELSRYVDEIPGLVKHGYAINFAFIQRTLVDIRDLQNKVYRGTFTVQDNDALLL